MHTCTYTHTHIFLSEEEGKRDKMLPPKKDVWRIISSCSNTCKLSMISATTSSSCLLSFSNMQFEKISIICETI